MTISTDGKSWTARIGAAGRLVIPAKVRQALDLRQGQCVLLKVRDGSLEICPARESLARTQAIARRHPLPGKERLSESLISDRRKAAARGE